MLTRVRRVWTRLAPILGDGSSRIPLLAITSAGTGLAEAGVLAFAAQAAATMVGGQDEVSLGLGPIGAELSVREALLAAWVLAILRTFLQLVVAWLPSRLSAGVQARLRNEVFGAYLDAAWPVQAGEREGHVQELVTGQVNHATEAVLHLATGLSASIMFLTLTGSAFVLSPPVAGVVLLTASTLFLALRPIIRWGRTAAEDLSVTSMAYANGVSEAVRLSEETQVFQAERALRERVATLVRAGEAALFRFHLAFRLSSTLYQSLVLVIVVGGLTGLWLSGHDDFAGLGAAVLMLVRSATYGQHAQAAYSGLNQTLPYVDRLQTTMSGYRESRQPDGKLVLSHIESLELRDACYAYGAGRDPALDNISVAVNAGESLGIVGPSGAGKSTLVQVLLGLRTPETGSFYVNGSPQHEFRRNDWRGRVAYVPQESKVFAGTIADNIRYFREISDHRIEQAARLAHIDQDITRMPAGYETVIGQRADALSGGQRQRLCLARALAGSPDVLILDEPTSALDTASEQLIEQSLSEMHGSLILVIIAHRLSLLRSCDRIAVIVDGSVQAVGSSSDLHRSSEFYRSITLDQRRQT